MMNNRRKGDKKLTTEQQGWADIVLAGGASAYQGTFGSIEECGYILVLFDSPQTGSTLAIKTTELTPDAVRAHIKASNAKFGL
jgi:hypothetical protein